MILISSQVRSYAYNAGFRGQALDYAVQIAKCESGFDTGINAIGAEDSRGLWQIHYPTWGKIFTGDLYNPQYNAYAAYQIYLLAGKSFRDWSCAKILGLVNPLDTIATVSTGTLAFVSIIALYLLSNE
jgi:hypothetical protein